MNLSHNNNNNNSVASVFDTLAVRLCICENLHQNGSRWFETRGKVQTVLRKKVRQQDKQSLELHALMNCTQQNQQHL